LKVANGPQKAYSVGIEYRDPKYWWIGATANYLSNSYVDISTITRTADFFINPEDPLGLPFENIDEDLAKQLLKQEEFEGYYLLNLTGGKSWRVKGNYISLFVSINNAFDETFRTGGYEQSRTANYNDLVEDNANGSSQRNFGNKYWFGFGRTFFVNVAFNF
ncbi:MAG: TonB-dependent receptor, partial [Bacteroidia bacterium]|nr:TonB-dependent receptor [Bacteroidia bacterium]